MQGDRVGGQPKWYELSGANAWLVDQFRPALVSFLAFTRESEPAFAGTGFVLAADEDLILVITAKHVLMEGVLRVQRPESAATLANGCVNGRLISPSVDPKKLKVSWMGSDHGEMLDVKYIQYCDTLDIAICLLMRQQGEARTLGAPSIPFDITTPNIGDVVHLVSVGGIEVDELNPPARDGSGQVLRIERRVSVRRGFVTGVYQNGLRHYRWPCFTTSAPAAPGMSGGFVTIPQPDTTVGACGVICADFSTSESENNQHIAGESVIAASWPALALEVPMWTADDAPKVTLYEMMQSGALPKALGGLDRIHISGPVHQRQIELAPPR